MITDSDMALLRQALADQGVELSDRQWQNAIDQLKRKANPKSWDEFFANSDLPSDEDRAYWNEFLADLNEERTAIANALKAVRSQRRS